MSWSRFKFHCKELLRLLERDEEPLAAFEKSKKSVLLKEFGPELEPNGIQSTILSSMMNEGFSSEEVKSAVRIYDALDIQELTNKPSRIRRVGIYIGYLTFMYFIFSSIYSAYVIPQTMSMFEALDVPPPADFLWFVDHWISMVIVVLLLLVVAFLVSRKVKDIFDYKNGVENSIIYRLFLPKKIKSGHIRLKSLLLLPLNIATKRNDGVNNHIIQHYISEAYSGKEIAESLSMVINENVNALLESSESHMRRIYVVVAVLIVFSIFQFISSAYTPLFVMGSVV